MVGPVVLAGVPVLGYDSLYATRDHRLPLAAAVLAGLLAAAPFAFGRIPLRRRIAGAVVLVLVSAAVAWLLTAPGPAAGPAELLDVARRLPTFHQPMDATASTLALPFVVTVVCAWCAAALLAAPVPAAPLVPAGVALSVQLLLCAGAGPDVAGAAAFATAAALVVLAARREPGWRTAVARPLAVLAVVGAAAAGTGLATSDDARERFDPRSRWSAGDPAPPQVAPLGWLKAELAGPGRERFTVRVSGPGAGRVELLPVATLDRYDGVSWTTDTDFRTSGAVLQAGAGGPRTSAELRIAELPGRLLPAPAQPVAMPVRPGGPGARTIGFDPGVGLVARTDPAGWSYTVESTDGVDRSMPRSGTTDVALLDDGSADPAVRTAVAEVRAARDRLLPPGPADDAALTGLETGMRARFPYSPDAPAGHSLDAVTRILGGTAPENGGYAEQRASAFALLARATGRPARVVAGYRLPPPGADGVTRVTAAEAHAWSEVRIDDRWLTYDPTDVSVPPTPFPGAALAAAAAPATVPVARPQAPPPTPRPPADGAWPAVAAWVVGALLATAVLLLLVALAVWAVAVHRGRVRERRRARERAEAERVRAARREARMSTGSPAQRVLGAWAEALDHLRRDGLVVPGAAGPRGVVRAAERAALPQLDPLTELAEHADRALFGARRPSEADAALAWRLEARATRAVTSRPEAAILATGQENR